MEAEAIPVAGYARVSSKDQEQYGFSLKTQVDNIIKRADDKGYRLVYDVFSEDITGTTLDRPELNKLMAAARNGEIKKVIAYEMDRLARRTALQVILEEELRKLNVEIEYVLYDFPDTPEGRFMKTVFMGLLELEREHILERTQRGRLERADNHLMPAGIPPYGYRYYRPSREEKGDYVIVPEEAEVVKQIFDWYVNEKVGCVIIAGRLTAKGVRTRLDGVLSKKTGKPLKTKRGEGAWCERTIYSILRNKDYVGIAHYKPKQWDEDTQKKVLTDESEWYSHNIEPIISLELWEAAQEQLHRNKKYAKRNTKEQYLMQSRLVCEVCGYTFQLFTKSYKSDTKISKYKRYVCKGQYKSYAPDGKTTTCHRYLNAYTVDDAVWYEIENMLSNPERIRQVMTVKQDTANAEAEIIRSRLSTIEDTIILRQEKRVELIQSLAKLGKSKATIELLQGEIAQNDKLLEELEFEAKPLRLQLASKECDADQGRIDRIIEWCKDIQRGLENITFEDKQFIVRELDIRGVVRRKAGGGCYIAFSGILPTIEVGSIDGKTLKTRNVITSRYPLPC